MPNTTTSPSPPADSSQTPNTALARSKSTNLSFAERKAQMLRASAPHLVEGDRLLRDIDRAPPGDVVQRSCKPQIKPELTKQRSNYFEDAFSVKDLSPVRERVRSEAMVVADVKTNVIIADEFTFITQLSYQLSTRYQRPVSSVVITLHHGACMLFAGSFDPAYLMTIAALPSQLQPATNRRNAALIQKAMEDILKVPASRGFLRFVPTPEENVAFNGRTTAGEIDDLERSASAGAGGREGRKVEQQGGAARGTKTKRRLSVKSFASTKPPSVKASVPELTPPMRAETPLPTPLPTIPQMPEDAKSEGEEKDVDVRPKAARRKKSFVANLFGRRAGKMEHLPTISPS